MLPCIEAADPSLRPFRLWSAPASRSFASTASSWCIRLRVGKGLAALPEIAAATRSPGFNTASGSTHGRRRRQALQPSMVIIATLACGILRPAHSGNGGIDNLFRPRARFQQQFVVPPQRRRAHGYGADAHLIHHNARPFRRPLLRLLSITLHQFDPRRLAAPAAVMQIRAVGTPIARRQRQET